MYKTFSGNNFSSHYVVVPSIIFPASNLYAAAFLCFTFLVAGKYKFKFSSRLLMMFGMCSFIRIYPRKPWISWKFTFIFFLFSFKSNFFPMFAFGWRNNKKKCDVVNFYSGISFYYYFVQWCTDNVSREGKWINLWSECWMEEKEEERKKTYTIYIEHKVLVHGW